MNQVMAQVIVQETAACLVLVMIQVMAVVYVVTEQVVSENSFQQTDFYAVRIHQVVGHVGAHFLAHKAHLLVVAHRLLVNQL